MAVVQEAPTAPAVTMERPRAVRVAAYVVLTCWIAVLVTAMLLGTRSATFTDLELGVQEGHVTRVEMTGGLPPGARGRATVHLVWRDGFFRYSTYVEQVSGHHPDLQPRGQDVSEVVDAPVADLLRGSGGQVQVDDRGRMVTFASTEILGWTVTDPFAPLVGLLAWFATIVLVALTPWPRRATSWAWAWFVLGLPVVGALAFLMLSGALRAAVAEPYRRPRMSGGWAFLLMLLVGGAIRDALG